jgi:hypothetical protein
MHSFRDASSARCVPPRATHEARLKTHRAPPQRRERCVALIPLPAMKHLVKRKNK